MKFFHDVELTRCAVEIIDSLHQAVSNAGGSIAWVSIENLKLMSAYDLLMSLSTNAIRFTYQKEAEFKQ
jgi:hypothetical protein